MPGKTLLKFNVLGKESISQKMYILRRKYAVKYCKTLIFNWSLTRLGKMSCKSFIIKKGFKIQI